MTKKAKYNIFSVLGFVFSVVPVLFVIGAEFPLWVERGWGCVMSGGALSAFSIFLMTIGVTPILKSLLAKMKTPAIPFVWGALALFFSAVEMVIKSLVLVASIGFLGNLIGFFFFSIAKRYKTV